MAVCAQAVNTPDGLILRLDPSETNVGACQYVLHTGMEWVNGSLTTMSPSDAAELAGLVCLLWAVAWGIRQVVRSIQIGENHAEENH